MNILLRARYYWLIPLAFWSFIIGLSLVVNLSRLDKMADKTAFERGNAIFRMVKMTKINPSVMLSRDYFNDQREAGGISYRIVSSKPENPVNLPDEWEQQALSKLKQKGDYAIAKIEQPAGEVYRYLAPVFAELECLACHADQNLNEGDLRGGISVTLLAAPIFAEQQVGRIVMLLIHLGGFLLLFSSSVFFLHHLRQQWREINLTRDKLEQSKSFLTSITNAMGEGFVVVDKKLIVSYVNPEAGRLLGWSKEDLLGKSFHDLVHAGAGDGHACDIRKTLTDGQMRKQEQDMFTCKNGKQIPVGYSVSAKLENGRIEALVISFDDISKRLEAEDLQRDLERQLNQTHKMEAVGQLAGGIAHEINTPIQYIGDNLRFLRDAHQDYGAVMGTFYDLLEQAKPVAHLQNQVLAVEQRLEEYDIGYLNREIPEAIEQSIGGAEQVSNTVVAMREFAHPGAKHKEFADLNKIVTNAVTVSKNRWKYLANIHFEQEPELPEVKCMSSEISQVVLNLIINASQAIEDAGLREGEKGEITLSTRLLEGGDSVEIGVTDTGNGIPDEIGEKIFNPFFTTKDVGRGTGQGLAIAQDIVVVKHGGRITFTSEMGRGTSFFIQLPVET